MNVRRDNRRGSALIEFSLSTLFWVPLVLGTTFIGLNLVRCVRVTQLCRDAGHMFASGVDFSQAFNRNLVVRLADGLNMDTTAGNTVIILSSITWIGAEECKAAGLAPDAAHCPNLSHAVLTKRIVIGNPVLRVSAFGTPPSGAVDSAGNISGSSCLKDTGARANGISNILTLASGQHAYVSEIYAALPVYAWNGSLTGSGVAARTIF